jgi:hypothetical protein
MARKASGAIAGLSVAQLQAEISRRQRGAAKLLRKRDSLIEKVREIESELAAVGAMVGRAGGIGGVRRRPKNEMNLVDALVTLLTDKTMSVTEASEEVQKAGYQTTSPSFRTIVNQTLINSGKFKRVSRGQYTAK